MLVYQDPTGFAARVSDRLVAVVGSPGLAQDRFVDELVIDRLA